MFNKTACFLFLAMSITMTACTSASNSSLPSSENQPSITASDPSNTIFFPRQKKTDGERAVMEGEVDGTLVLADNCVRIDSEEADTSYMLIWPPDFNITVENGTIEIMNEDGEVVAHIGDSVHIGGGEIHQLLMLDKFIQQQVPPQCTAPYWIIGDW